MAALFQNVNDSTGFTRGSLISFGYPLSFAKDLNMIHDPRPMVIVTDIWPAYIRGVNLHYLTLPYVRKIITAWAGNMAFNYSSIQGDPYIKGAFRMYAVQGIQQPRKLDTEWLKNMLQIVRSFDLNEVEAIRQNIQQQLQNQLQTKANDLNTYPTQSGFNPVPQVNQAFGV